jgi:glycosyltransferase involved in cell wall biosynthesis
MTDFASRIGVVVIGRNEGDRLIRSLDSVVPLAHAVVYVDSGSTDGSCDAARQRGVEVVTLDLSLPFTAARSRNAGFDRLNQIHPHVEYVQFIDGDCEVLPGWLEQATNALDCNPGVVAVCGWRQERHPERTIYNRLCNVEWHMGSLGETDYVGGDAMFRVAALVAAGGYNPNLIAGEEPELCVRLRQAGWKIQRLDFAMTLHDAQMTQFRQWWRRMHRAGYAYAEGSWLHGRGPQRHWLRESRRIWLWGLVIPGTILVTALPTQGLSLLLLSIYPVSVYRTCRYLLGRGFTKEDAIPYSFFCLLDKFPLLQGQIQFHLNRLLNRRQQMIEYKTAAPTDLT